MTQYSFNSGWKFFRGVQNSEVISPGFDDSPWEAVTLGHTVRLEPVNVSGGLNYQGDAWYRKRFIFDDTFKGKKLYIKFEAAMHETEVYLNGREIKRNFCGYLPFVIDVTDDVLFNEENVIAVRVNNEDNADIPPGRPQQNLDFCYFGGIYRNAWLIKKDSIHITDELYEDEKAGGGIFVRYENVSREYADILIKTHIRNDSGLNEASGKISYIIKDKGKCIKQEEQIVSIEESGTFEIRLRIEKPKLWSVTEPNLYELTVETEFGDYIDCEALKIGIKDIRFTERDCILNGEKVLLTGCNRHQEYPWIGNALPDSLQYRDAYMIKKAGWNIVRTGHYPQAKAFMDACDELGILVITPTPGWQFYPAENHDIFDKRVEENVRHMVRYLRNHASIAFWEPIINEEGKTPDEFRRMTYNAVHEEYPGEQCYCAIDEEYDTESLYDIIYKKTMEKNPHKPGFTREYGDTWKEQTEWYEPKHYRVNREENAFGGFYPGGKRAMIDNMLARTVSKGIDGNDTDYPRSIKQKHIAYKEGLNTGFCLWAGFDHNRGGCSNPACVGAIDFYRIPKYQYYSYQAQSKAVEPMIFIAEYEDRAWCISNCETVRLYRDGVCLGERPTGEDPDLPSVPAEFSLNGNWNELKAEGYNGGTLAASQVKKKSGVPRKIILTAPNFGVTPIADGNDKIMIYAHVVDENGTVCENVTVELNYVAEGAAKIVGALNPRIMSSKQSVSMGIGAFLIETEKTTGEIVLKAWAKGLEPGILRIKTVSPKYAEIPYRLCGNTECENVEYEEDRKKEQEQKREQEQDKNRVDFAKEKQTWASSGDSACGNDGNPNTGWIADLSDTAPEWNVDLGEEKELSGLRILWNNDSTTYTYDIEISGEDHNFKTALSTSGTGQDIGIIPFKQSNVRYIRVKIKNVSKGTAGFYMFELY